MEIWLPIFFTSLCYLIPNIVLFKKTTLDNRLANFNSILVGLGLLAHFTILKSSISFNPINLSFSNALITTSFFSILIFWVLNFNKNFNYLQPFLLIPSIFLLIIHPLFLSNHYLTNDLSPLFITHIAVALFAYSLFTFSAYLALFILFFENKLHQKKKMDVILNESLPLIEMENFLLNINKIGFALLTIALISGVLFSEELFETPLQFNHKTVFSILAWFIYGFLLAGKKLYGWRGKKSMYISLTAFLFLVLSYLGSKFVLEIILHR
ncbi:MAG: cytochrome C biogenesis protein [Candidatus Methylopumilus sp.]|nr:cytochrome C biogenesis protein [Candidatus Methylopumilus sp.]